MTSVGDPLIALGDAVVTDFDILESGALHHSTSTQYMHYMHLSGPVLLPRTSVTIYTDSRYAFCAPRDFGRFFNLL